MVLIPFWQIKVAEDAVSYFGLKIVSQNCEKVTDKLFNDNTISLCPVVSQ